MTELLWKRIPLVFGLALWFAFPQTTAFSSPSPNALTRIDLQSLADSEKTTLIFQGKEAFRYTTFSLQQPPRLVIDLRKTDVRAFQGRYPVSQGPLKQIELQSFPGSESSLGRILVHLRHPIRWNVRTKHNALHITFAQATPEAALQAFLSVSSAPSASPPAQRHAVPKHLAPVPSKESRLVWRSGVQRVEATAGRRASRLLRISQDNQSLRLKTNGSIRAYEILELRNPSRLVLDLYGLQKGLASPSFGCDRLPIQGSRWGRHPGKVRLVFEACPSASSLRSQIHVKGSTLRLSFQGASSASAQPTPNEQHTFASSGSPLIEEIGFGETTTHSSILIQTNHPSPRYSVLKRGTSLLLILQGARLSPKTQTFLDTSEFQGALRSFRARQRPSGVEILASLREDVEHKIQHQGDLLRWNFQRPSRPHTTAQGSNFQITYHPQNVAQAGRSAMTPDVAATLAQQTPKKRYRGRRISMYFRLVDIHNLLRLFSEISGLNIVTSGDVRGNITLKLRNVPWDQALDVVLRTLKLGQEEEGNIIRIATLEELRKEEEERQKLQEARLLAQPQKIRLIPVNYADATELMARIRTVLSPRGDVAVDNRTNVLIVKDYPAFLLRAESLARNLDTQTPQVLIETRIVEANVNFERQFGIQWGGQLLFSPQLGNGTGLLFPNPIGVRGGVPDAGGGGAVGGPNVAEGGFGTPNYVVNFPATTGRGRGTAVNFLFGSLSGAFNLELRLSAAESAGEVKIISSPKIVTLHKNSAMIQQGLQIPFATASAAGTNVQFIAATLSLNVTPQVTADGSVFIKLQVSNNAPDFSRGGAAGPAITTKTANTNMLIKDGETMVIGGIYSRRTGSSENRVPFLGTIPILGALFKNYTYNDDRAELLIFVTPRIINRAQTIGGRS